MEQIRIFIASPSDVAEERLLAYRVIERLIQAYSDRAQIQAVMWEHEPLLATSDFQSQIANPAEADIFVLMLWGRLGSPLGPHFARSDGSPFASATEYEFEEALAAYKKNGKPRVLVYRKSTPLDLDAESARTESAAVDRFFDRWFVNPEDHTATAAYHTFSELSRLEDILELHLRKSLLHFLPNPNNLPAPVNAFIGRHELTAKVLDLLTDEEVRLVTLAGPGGTGKTRLALHLGRELLPRFDNGVFFISLASVTDPELVPSAIASTLGIKESVEEGTASIIRELKRKRVLLLLDNLEQVQSSGKHLSVILSECPDVKAIVTSREALRLNGARTIRVPPLELPNAETLPSLEDLREVESVRLFVARAKAVRDDFELTEETVRNVVEICRRIDALPLAIELAASRVRTMSTERLLLAMDQRFKVLKGGAEDVLDHQKSLRKLIAWSYDLLDESEQRLWRRLSVFPDGCGIDSAQQVCASDDEYIMEVDIEPLVDKSLVNIQFNSNSTVSRVSMLESLREYAHEKLIDSSEFNLIQGRFCEWCLRIGFPDTGTATGPAFEVLKRIDIEYNNVCAALEYCLSERRAETALSLSSSLYYYWFDRGLFSEGVSWLQKTLDVDDGIVTTSRGDVLTSLSGLLRQQNRLSDALGPAGEALEIYSKLKNDKKRAKVLCELGAISARLGDLDSATNYLDECLDLAQAEQMVDRSMSVFLSTRGVVEHLKGDLVAAKALYVEGLKIGRGVGDKDSTATALLNLGEIVEAEGNTHEAHEHYRDSLKLYGDLGHKLAIAYCAEVIAGLEVRANSHSSEAAFLFGAAEAIREEIEAPVESFNTERIEDDKRRTREAMDEDDSLAAWEAGRQLGIDGVLRHVLGGIST